MVKHKWILKVFKYTFPLQKTTSILENGRIFEKILKKWRKLTAEFQIKKPKITKLQTKTFLPKSIGVQKQPKSYQFVENWPKFTISRKCSNFSDFIRPIYLLIFIGSIFQWFGFHMYTSQFPEINIGNVRMLKIIIISALGACGLIIWFQVLSTGALKWSYV